MATIIVYSIGMAGLAVIPGNTQQRFHIIGSAAVIGILFALSVALSNEALFIGSFPSLVMGNMGKPLPIFIFLFFFGSRHCTKTRFRLTFMILIGFLLITANKDDKLSIDTECRPILSPDLLSALCLLLDAVVVVFKERTMTILEATPYQIMFFVNIFSVALMLLASNFFNVIRPFYQFVGRHPLVLLKILLLSICGSLGQILLNFLISLDKRFDCVVIKLVQKICSITFSIFYFENTLNFFEFSGTFLIFLGTIFDAYTQFN